MGIAQEIKTLADQLNLTQYDEYDQPYILTKSEEDSAIRNAIEAEKNILRHRASKNCFEGEVEAKIKATDWENKINRGEILKKANKSKHYKIWENEQRDNEKKEEITIKEFLIKKCDANYFFNFMKRTCIGNFGKQFQHDDLNRDLIKTICFFLSRDKRFETELNFDPNKGLIIRGVSGLGKTFLFECVMKNELNPVKIVSMIEVADEIKSDGRFNILFEGEKILYLDDVGTEVASVNHYGTKINWFKEFIEKQYMEKNSFKSLVLSTNLNFSGFEENYGFRVRSRIKEMFNVVNIDGNDRRK